MFSGSNDGALRAYSTEKGAIVWHFDTNREFKTLDRDGARRVDARRGGPLRGGTLYVNSGDGDHSGRPGTCCSRFEVQ